MNQLRISIQILRQEE